MPKTFALKISSIIKSVILCLLLVNNCHGAQPAAPSTSFNWADDQDFGPYIYLNANNKPEGLFLELMTEAFNRIKLPLAINLYPWKRAQLLTLDNQADGMVTVPTPERLKDYIASKPLLIESVKLHIVDDNPQVDELKKITKLDELANYFIISYIGNGWTEQHISQHNMVWAPNYPSAMKMLAQNRADVFIGSEYSVLYTINKLQNDDANNFPRLARIIATDNAIDALSYSLLINKRSPYINLIQQFNATLDEMRDDGSYDRIIRQYFTKKLNAKKLPSFIALPTQ